MRSLMNQASPIADQASHIEIFSDFHITPDIKIEVLSTDILLQVTDVLCPEDRLVGVFRGVGGKYVATTVRDEFVVSFRYEARHSPVEEALENVVDNKCFTCFHEVSERNDDFSTIKHQGAMLLVIYISPNKTMDFVQVGNVTMKQRVNGKFLVVTQDHTFDNPEELNEIVVRKLHGKYLGDYSVNDHLNFIALKCFDIPDPENRLGKGLLLPGIPSRFIAHVDYCGILNDKNTWLINTQAYIGKIKP